MAIKFAAKDQEAATVTAKAPDKRSDDRKASAPNDVGETPATDEGDLFNTTPTAPTRKRKSKLNARPKDADRH